MQLVLRNIAEERRTVRLHVVGAEVNDSGAPTLLGVADAPFVTLDDQQVTLEPGESREIEVWIDPRKLTEGTTAHYAGFVLETSEGETLLMRAASVVRITGVRSPLPSMPFLIALLLLVGAGAATRRQHRVGKRLLAA